MKVSLPRFRKEREGPRWREERGASSAPRRVCGLARYSGKVPGQLYDSYDRDSEPSPLPPNLLGGIELLGEEVGGGEEEEEEEEEEVYPGNHSLCVFSRDYRGGNESDRRVRDQLDNFSRVGGSERFSERFSSDRTGNRVDLRRPPPIVVSFAEERFVPESRRAR